MDRPPVVAKRDLAIGTFVQGPQDLDWGPVPAETTPPPPPPPANADNAAPENTAPAETPPTKETYLHEGAVRLTDFNGAVVRRSLHAGDPVPQNALMKSGEGGFMSAVLNPSNT